MMKLKRQIGPILGLAAAISLAACGGGSSNNDSSGNNNPPPPAAPVGVTSIGAITGFGSVFVNGARYGIDSGSIIAIEGQADIQGDDSALRIGMKVRVSALDDNGVRTAQRIEYDEDLKGPIESISPDPDDPTIGAFSLMSQVVTVDANTAFDDDVGNNDGVAGIDFRDLQIGMVVEVSGFPTDNGFLATRVDREIDGLGGNTVVGDPAVNGDELELKGFVDDVANDLSSITVGGVVFMIGQGTLFQDGLVLDMNLVGQFVEVKADIVGGEYHAVSVEPEDDFNESDRNGEFEIEGILQAIDTSATPNTFTINGITVPVSNASSLDPLVGLQVEIEGSFDSNGVLLLREAHEEVEDNVRTADLVATVDTTGTSFTTRLGLVISPTGGSRLEDDASGSGGGHLTPEQFIGRLAMGDRIESRGFEGSASAVVWTRVHRDDLAIDNNDFECELRGPVTSITGDANAFSFVIQGVTVQTGRLNDSDFKGADNLAIGRAEFFRLLRVGSIVDAESFEGDEFCMSGMLDARQVEFE